MKTEFDSEQITNHLVRCYANVQNVIRFLDTKAAVVFTISGIMLGAIATKQVHSCDWARGFLCVSVIFTIVAMILALRAVCPSHGPKDPKYLTLLFPALHPSVKGSEGESLDVGALVRMKLQQPLTADFVQGEYGSQLEFLNQVLTRKVSALRGAIRSITVAIIAIGICQFGQRGRSNVDDPLKVEANCKVQGPVTVQLHNPRTDLDGIPEHDAASSSNTAILSDPTSGANTDQQHR